MAAPHFIFTAHAPFIQQLRLDAILHGNTVKWF
jgi:hypothetical protein